MNANHAFYTDNLQPRPTKTKVFAVRQCTIDPLFVNPFATPSCPNDYPSCDWGTLAFPYHALSSAIDRASPAVTVQIQTGQYQLTNPGNPRTVNKPLVLKANGGSITIH
jgi:hypothetical protein